MHLDPEEPRRTDEQIRPPRLHALLDDRSPGQDPVELGHVSVRGPADPVG
ncbi:hypothetical protein [Streptomyces xanthochromogenes]|nr:hypothetical protein [Streptomyces xanthochromogenes]